MPSESRDKIRSLKASLNNLVKRSSFAQTGGIGPTLSYCSAGRDSCGNQPYCRSTCAGGQLVSVPNDATPYTGDCVKNSNWSGGIGNFYPCIESGLGVPPCPIDANPDSCNYGKTIAEFYRKCCCSDCCCCPDDSNDPNAYDCDNKPKNKCNKWKDTRNDNPWDHGWVTGCDSVIADHQNMWGVTIPNVQLKKLPTTTSGGHQTQRETAQALDPLVQACRQTPGCTIDPQGTPNQKLGYQRLAACVEYRKSNFSTDNSCGHPFSNSGMWRGWGLDVITNPCKDKWKEACKDITGACCRELSGGTLRCSEGKTWKECYNLPNGPGTWHGRDSTCDSTICEEEGYYDDYDPDNYDENYEYEGGEPRQMPDTEQPTSDATKISANPPLKKPSKTTGPFQGLLFNKCDPSTWRVMQQPDVDDQGNPVAPTFDPRPRLCRRDCHEHPLLKDYDCSRVKGRPSSSKSAVSSLIKAMRIRE